jgi:AraC-like DNA-binding protein
MSIGQLLLIALIMAQGRGPIRLRVATVLMLITVSAYLTNSAPLFQGWRGLLDNLIELGSQLSPFMIWLFMHRMFERRLPPILATIGLAVILANWVYFTAYRIDPPYVFELLGLRPFHLIGLLLIGHGIIVSLRDLADDLVERRRVFRQVFVMVIAAQCVAVLVTEVIFTFGRVPLWLMLTQSLFVLSTATALGWAMLREDAELLAVPIADNAKLLDDWSPAEKVLHGRLESAMADGAYRRAALTIGELAGVLDVPEHRLRALINQRMGFRNFSTYLNEHRIAEAKNRLADPDIVSLPVLTIAMDLGYGSLAPFNRAFKSAAGQTPTEFRRAALGGAGPVEAEKS